MEKIVWAISDWRPPVSRLLQDNLTQVLSAEISAILSFIVKRLSDDASFLCGVHPAAQESQSLIFYGSPCAVRQGKPSAKHLGSPNANANACANCRDGVLCVALALEESDL